MTNIFKDIQNVQEIVHVKKFPNKQLSQQRLLTPIVTFLYSPDDFIEKGLNPVKLTILKIILTPVKYLTARVYAEFWKSWYHRIVERIRKCRI